jgi:hypothetical protein
MRHVPWITLAIAVIFFISPPSLKLINSAFCSGEQLARSLSQFVLEVMLAIFIGVAIIEWGIKFYLRRRRSKRTSAATSP